MIAAHLRDRGAGRFRLVRRSPTLSGNVPLRAAQSCPPFLSGNVCGWQLVPARPLRLRRTLLSVEADPPPLRARLAGPETAVLTWDTGLSLRPAEGVVLVLERAYNRRDRRVLAHESVVSGDVLLTVTVAIRRADGEVTLGGELASLLAFAPAPEVAVLALADVARLPPAEAAAARGIAAAHLSFFDQEYFGEKRAAPTRKYRDLLRRAGPGAGEAADDLAGSVVVLHGGGAVPAVQRSPEGLLRLELPVEVGARLRYHGHRVEVRLDEGALGRRAADIEARFRAALGDGAGPELGALRYFTTYVTPHSPGDAHLFCKPATLLRTPPGWVAVLDGVAAPGWEVLRGVTDASWFPALPAVIEVHAAEVHLAAGAPLLRVRPLPRWLLDAELFREPGDARG